MRILITGNMGYVGPVLTRFLRENLTDAELIGFDTAYFAHSLTGAGLLPEALLDRQVFGDIREFRAELLDGVDAVVHLSAISNDPMGNKFETVTSDINQQASTCLARLAADRGVKSFVFASSCSMYGNAEGGARKESDPTNPLTAYARSKIGSEKAFAELDLGGMTVTSLRFATACGMSERLRLDLVLNDFVACAMTSGEITVLSDGTPWRPLIDVEDMARAIAWAIARKPEIGGKFLAVNAGRDESNYRVRDLAEAVARHVPGTKVSINAHAPPDKRSYRVNFALFKSIAPDHIPQITLDESIRRLREGLASMGFADKDFRTSSYMRLKALERHIAAGRLGPDLHWCSTLAPRGKEMQFRKTPLEGAYLVELEKRNDERGFFARLFCEKEFRAAGLETRFVQANNSLTLKKGALRGLHYQLPPAAEVKVVRAIRGALWDVIVDLRPGSPSYLKWFGAELSEDNRSMLYIPRGFGHGFITLTDNVEAFYLHSACYSPEVERGLRWNDPAVRIEWPLQPREMSDKDRKWPDLNPEFHGVDAMRGFLFEGPAGPPLGEGRLAKAGRAAIVR